jgi:long-chain acyl-CoA synthetase
MLTNYNLTQYTADWLAVLGGLMPETKVDLLWLPTSHIFGWGELGLGNLLNFTTYFTTPYEALKVMPQVKPTVFFSVPAYWESLYIQSVSASTDKNAQIEKLRQLTGGRLKFCLSGGAGLKREAKTFFYEAGLLIIEGYGLTECSPTLTMNRGDDFDFDTVGKAFPSVQLKIASDGELLAKGPNVFQGYYKNPEATQETFDSEGWFKTGDLVELTNKGFYKIRGRKKDIIVTSGGKNIAPLSIEAIFINNPYIEHIVLYGNERKYLTALVTLREQTASAYAKNLNIPFDSFSELIERKEIIQLVHDQIEQANLRLASFETVKRFFIYDGHLTVEDDFLTPSLKLKRKNVHERFKERFEALYELKRD